jgi:hypothetical protein
MILFRTALPKTAPSLVSAQVLANHSGVLRETMHNLDRSGIPALGGEMGIAIPHGEAPREEDTVKTASVRHFAWWCTRSSVSIEWN